MSWWEDAEAAAAEGDVIQARWDMNGRRIGRDGRPVGVPRQRESEDDRGE